MRSNSKLSKNEKTALKDIKILNPDLCFANDGYTTFAYKIKGNLVLFATSIMSDTEIKFRRKVGEFYAVSRFVAGEYSILKYTDFCLMLETAFEIDVWP